MYRGQAQKRWFYRIDAAAGRCYGAGIIPLEVVMRSLLFAAVPLIAVAGCQTYNPAEQAQVARNAAMAVTCAGPDDCEVKWGRALQWVLKTGTYRIQVQSDNLIQTAGPNENDPSPAYVVSRVPLGGGKYEFSLQAGCDNIFGCIPSNQESHAAFAVSVMGGGA